MLFCCTATAKQIDDANSRCCSGSGGSGRGENQHEQFHDQDEEEDEDHSAAAAQAQLHLRGMASRLGTMTTAAHAHHAHHRHAHHHHHAHAHAHHHYNLNAENPYMNNSLQDLNSVEAPSNPHRIDAISDVDNDNDSNSTDCVHQSYGSTLQLQGVSGVESEQSLPLESDEPSRSPYGVLTNNDVMPIESARARFLQLILDNFLKAHVVEVPDSPEPGYSSSNGNEKQKRKKPREMRYEGDSSYVLPLAYVANLYETLVNDVNLRLATLEGPREKTIGVALEAAGGLYRRLVKKFPRTGPCVFKRREMASALEAKTKFPELVTREEKRVRFVVVHGLEIVEQPAMSIEDAEWFRRLTGRHEAIVSERDYKFYSARHKYRRAPQNILSPVPGLPTSPNPESSTLGHAGLRSQYSSDVIDLTSQSPHHIQLQPHHPLTCIPHHGQNQQSHQSHYPPIHPSHQQSPLSQLHHGQHCSHVSQLEEVPHTQHASVAQHIPRNLQPSPGLHVGGRMVILPTGPPKFCDQCGRPYLRETSKFCSECGAKRLGV